jgi:maltooligosyltrehalose trehalohydrolase
MGWSSGTAAQSAEEFVAVPAQRSGRVVRRLPIGAETHDGRTQFRVWAPAVSHMEVAIVDSAHAPEANLRRLEVLAPEGDGYFSGTLEDVGAGALYMFRLDHDALRGDPASRFQPAGPHGPSMVIDPAAFQWTVPTWPAPGTRADVVYELHIGTFTPEGTWTSAIARLPRLADLGITILEVMPVCEFSGRYGWGYDGVSLFAPYHRYGTPDDLRRFVDAAHRVGLDVVLDVVYNHFGPDGCYLREFAPEYFSKNYDGEWGDPVNFDGERCGGPREFVKANARYWISEFRLDGLRLDATQAIFDRTDSHIVGELIAEARAATSRRVWVVAENEPQHTRLVRPPATRGFGGDALWNDDFHHSAVVAATGRRDGYYCDYEGTAQEFVSAAKHGYLYQGQYYSWQKQSRGSYALDVPARAFVCFLENHDQVANSLRSRRLHQLTSPSRFRALSALLVLGPWVPMLFQGQEWGSDRPFHYFADMPANLRDEVTDGRKTFLAQFPGCAAFRSYIADPCAPATFEESRLDEPADGETARLYRDLIRLRHDDEVFQAPERIDGSVLGDHAFLLRVSRGAPAWDRLIVVNLATTLRRAFCADPLLAPPPDCEWTPIWDSERAEYGGNGIGDCDVATGLRISGECAVVFRGSPRTAETETQNLELKT